MSQFFCTDLSLLCVAFSGCFCNVGFLANSIEFKLKSFDRLYNRNILQLSNFNVSAEISKLLILIFL